VLPKCSAVVIYGDPRDTTTVDMGGLAGFLAADDAGNINPYLFARVWWRDLTLVNLPYPGVLRTWHDMLALYMHVYNMTRCAVAEAKATARTHARTLNGRIDGLAFLLSMHACTHAFGWVEGTLRLLFAMPCAPSLVSWAHVHLLH
jgi:hypothetical protein